MLNPSTDSGVIGDNSTTFQSLSLSGTSEPNAPIRVYDGLAGVGGARADSTGRWTVATTPLSIAVHTLTATASDQAGNVSARSGALTVTITSQTLADRARCAEPHERHGRQRPGQPRLDRARLERRLRDHRLHRHRQSRRRDLLERRHGCTVVGLSNGTSYSFTVTATNAVGTGAPSNALSATPVAPATVPGAPSLTSATRGNASVALGWSAPASNGGSAITGYTATASPGGATCSSAGTSCTVGGLSNGTSYSFTVTASNAMGTGSPSNAMSAMPATVPGAPSLTSATAGNGQVSLAWTAPASNGGSAITSYTATASPGGATCSSSGTAAPSAASATARATRSPSPPPTPWARALPRTP